MADDLEAVADELYGLVPGEFTAARHARAADARAAGDRGLAAAVRKLRRPTTSAWLANLLVRERPAQVDELLELGAALREAQERLAGEDLRRLSQQRHQVVSALGLEARKLADQAGHPVGEDAERELEGTLEAALADPAAGEALRSGRLVSALAYSGLGSVDVSGAVATPARTAPAPSPGKRPAKVRPADRATAEDDEDERRRERLRAAREALREAEAAATDARAAAAERERAVDEARSRQQRIRDRITDLQRELAELQGEQGEAGKEVRAAERSLASAERAVATAAASVERATAAVERLEG